MKFLTSIVLVLLLFVALAGLSPPTKKDAPVASVSAVQHMDVQQSEAAQVAPESTYKVIVANTSGAIEVNPYKQSEVVAVARAGSQSRQTESLTNYESHRRGVGLNNGMVWRV